MGCRVNITIRSESKMKSLEMAFHFFMQIFDKRDIVFKPLSGADGAIEVNVDE